MGKERLRGRGLGERLAVRAVCGRTMPMSIAIPPAGGAEGRAPRGRLMPGLLSPAEAQGELCSTRAHPGFYFFFLSG